MSLFELLLGLLPAILLVVALLCGRFPGEEAIARLAASVARRKARPHAPKALAATRRVVVSTLRASELVAHSLASRPPPASAVL